MDFATFRETRTYNFLTALPLVLWYGVSLWWQIPLLLADVATFGGDLAAALQLLSVAGAAVFYLAVICALLLRRPPKVRSQGFAPRATALIGTFMSLTIFYLPAVRPSLALQGLADGLIFAGCAVSALIVWSLGRNFSVLPEARGLVTSGPYAYARHPLYTAESLIIIGTAIQFAQPWAGILGVVNLVFVYARTVFEERVLEQAHPQYAAYRARTARFLPGVY